MKKKNNFRPEDLFEADRGSSQRRVRRRVCPNISGPTIFFRISLLTLITVLGLLSSLWIFAQVHAQVGAQQGRIDGFTFFIPYRADELDDQFDAGYDGSAVPGFTIIDDNINTTISISVLRASSIIYYDHWEDGLEPDLTTPTQFSTQVWGDNDPANGIPPGFGTDVLNAGDVIVLENEVVLPRDPADLFFDGGDSLTSIGGAIAVTLAVWPIHNGPPNPPVGPAQIGILYAGAWELYPTNAWGEEYLIPVGEDLAAVRPGFTVVGLNVQAVQDGTTVDVDLDADGTFETTVTLNQGEQFTQVNGVLVGARVRSSDPVQVHVFTANPASNYEARAYTMVPRDQWTDDYLAPRSSDGDFWLHNPDGNVLDITVQTMTTTVAITIPGNSTVKYPPVGLSAATGIRFTSDDGRPFYGVAALDVDQVQDWGYALQPVEKLSTQTLIGLGLGNNNMPPGPNPVGDGFESRVYVTAASMTTIHVDYDTNGTVDADFPVLPLQEVSITDPNDFNMTGAFLFTDDGTPFVTAWGQDESANPGAPSIDVGTSIVPLSSLLVQKTFNLIDDVDCTGSITLDDTVQFRLEYMNNSVDAFTDATIEDNLPSALTYVDNSAVANGASIPDGGGGSPFPLDAGGFNAGVVPAFGTGFITFDAVVNDTAAPITNEAQVGSPDLPLGTDSVTVLVPTGPTTPILEVNHTLISPADGLATSGQVITFSLTITNTSGSTITSLPLEETFNDNRLTFLSATPSPDATAAGLVSWNDLTTIFGSLLPNTTISATISFVVDQLPATVNRTNIVATVLEAQRNDSPTRLTCSSRASVNFGGGPPTDGDGGGGGGDGDGGDRATPTPTPMPTPTVSTLVEPTPTVFPATFLPETGTRNDLQADNAIIGVVLLVVLLGIGVVVLLARRRLEGK